MRRKLLLLTLLYLFFGVSPVSAEFSISVPKTTIASDEEIETTVTLSLQSQNNKTYYLEGAFKKEGATNYFGLTWNDSSWIPYTSSNFTTLKSITTDQDGIWNGVVKIKIDEGSSLFSGGGTYILRMKRFTSGGSASWNDSDITLTVSAPSPTSAPPPTPTPTHTPVPTKTPTPIPTPKPTPARNASQSVAGGPTPKKSPSPTNTPAPTSAPNPTPENTPIPEISKKISYQVASVAAVTAIASQTATIVKTEKQLNPIIWVGLIFIFAGVGLLGYIYIKKNAKIHFPFGKRNKKNSSKIC